MNRKVALLLALLFGGVAILALTLASSMRMHRALAAPASRSLLPASTARKPHASSTWAAAPAVRGSPPSSAVRRSESRGRSGVRGAAAPDGRPNAPNAPKASTSDVHRPPPVQRSAFLDGEGDAFFERNRHMLTDELAERDEILPVVTKLLPGTSNGRAGRPVWRGDAFLLSPRACLAQLKPEFRRHDGWRRGSRGAPHSTD